MRAGAPGPPGLSSYRCVRQTYRIPLRYPTPLHSRRASDHWPVPRARSARDSLRNCPWTIAEVASMDLVSRSDLAIGRIHQGLPGRVLEFKATVECRKIQVRSSLRSEGNMCRCSQNRPCSIDRQTGPLSRVVGLYQTFLRRVPRALLSRRDARHRERSKLHQPGRVGTGIQLRDHRRFRWRRAEDRLVPDALHLPAREPDPFFSRGTAADRDHPEVARSTLPGPVRPRSVAPDGTLSVCS